VPHNQAPYWAVVRAGRSEGDSIIVGREDARALMPSSAKREIMGFALRAYKASTRDG
jgi:hypothetical protein